MEIIADSAIVTGIDSISGNIIENGTEMPMEMAIDFTLRIRWVDDQWKIYTTE